MGSILLKNIKIAGRGDDEVDILIKDGKISRISAPRETVPSPEDEPLETVQCRGKVAVPGFVNMHVHAAMTLMRGTGEDVAFHRWLGKIWEAERHR